MNRPTLYQEEYKTRIVELMATGLSLTAAAAELGVTRQTCWNWGQADKEFFDAISLGQGKRTLFLERRLLSATEGPVVTSSIFALKNSAPEEWREKQEHQISGSLELSSKEQRDAAVAAAIRADG